MDKKENLRKLLEDLTILDIYALMLFLYENQYIISSVSINQWRSVVGLPKKDI